MSKRFHSDDLPQTTIDDSSPSQFDPSAGSIDISVAEATRGATSTATARKALNWGSLYTPPIKRRQPPKSLYLKPLRELRRLADQIRTMAAHDGSIPAEAAPYIVQLNDVLEELFDSDGGEALKDIIALIQAQVLSANWSLAHANLVTDLAKFLFSQSLINETAIREVVRMIEEAGLDIFRGTLSTDSDAS
jgi:hypothetical protein